MWYFGLVTGVYINRDRPVGYGFKALIGGGEATVAQQYYAYPARSRVAAPRPPSIHGRLSRPASSSSSRRRTSS
jgi:hypothetical protein